MKVKAVRLERAAERAAQLKAKADADAKLREKRIEEKTQERMAEHEAQAANKTRVFEERRAKRKAREDANAALRLQERAANQAKVALSRHIQTEESKTNTEAYLAKKRHEELKRKWASKKAAMEKSPEKK